MRPDISVVISTYNRKLTLAKTIESILCQPDPPAYELIVVDNRSTDGTAEYIQTVAEKAKQVRYVFEPKPGVSHGRNAGIAAADAPLIAFTDDDVVVSGNWLSTIKKTFDAKPEFGCVGGKVLPHWPVSPPAWITQNHWAPLALLDYGPSQAIDADNRKCLITANMAARRSLFQQIGGFHESLQKSPGSSCSMEDRELQERYWEVGGRCWFNPEIVVHADVQPFRLERRYHRRWHYSHGQLHALLKDPGFERSSLRVLGVPGHVWRRFIHHSVVALACRLSLRGNDAFLHEVEARFLAGYIRARLGQLAER